MINDGLWRRMGVIGLSGDGDGDGDGTGDGDGERGN